MRVLLYVIILLLLAPAPVRAAAGLPAMLARTHYVGERQYEGGSYRAHLYFGLNGGFVLREDTELSNGKVSSWEITGEWRQIRDGAFVQLTNSAQRRLLTVGGEGVLYLEARLPAGGQATVELRLREPSENSRRLEFSVNGKVRFVDGQALLSDDETGIVYHLNADCALPEALRRQLQAAETPALPVRARLGLTADAAPSPKAALLDIRQLPEEQRWETSPQNPADDFLRDIAGRPWKITRMDGEKPRHFFVLAFQPDPARQSGKLELFDGYSRLKGKFALRGREISFSVPKARGMHKELAGIIRKTRTWRLVGEVLELWGKKGRLALLESPRR
jgi:hypothetical protein